MIVLLLLCTVANTLDAKESIFGFADSDGLKIHYKVYGSGPPLVLVHGWGSDLAGNWEQTGWVDFLKAHRRVITLDIRGHGKSDKPLKPELYSYHRMAADVLAVMDQLGIQRAEYLGYSMGAFIGAYLLGHHSDRVSAMVFGGIGNETPESIAAAGNIANALRADDVSTISDPLGQAFRKFIDSNPEHTKSDREVFAISALQMWPEGFPIKLAGPGLKSVDAPVLAVVGADDYPYAETVQDVVEMIPGARLIFIPEHDHLSVVTAHEFKDAVSGFLGIDQTTGSMQTSDD